MTVVRRWDELIRQAIANRRLVRFEYKGNERVVEPHDYGIQNGRVRLLCWQIDGKSNGPMPGWRLVDVDGIDKCEVLGRTFPGNREVLGTHRRWDEIFIRVAPPEKESSRRAG